MTELLTFTIYFAFFANLFGGTLVYNGITVPLVLTSFGERRPPKKYLGERCSPSTTYTTCDGCYFQIHKLQYLCNAHLTLFKIF